MIVNLSALTIVSASVAYGLAAVGRCAILGVMAYRLRLASLEKTAGRWRFWGLGGVRLDAARGAQVDEFVQVTQTIAHGGADMDGRQEIAPFVAQAASVCGLMVRNSAASTRVRRSLAIAVDIA